MMNREEAWLLKEKYDGEENAAFLADCERLKAGEPLAYVIGFVPFLDCRIYLDSRPLIPRPETEFWVECAIKEINQGLTQASRKASPKCLEGDDDSCLRMPSADLKQRNQTSNKAGIENQLQASSQPVLAPSSVAAGPDPRLVAGFTDSMTLQLGVTEEERQPALDQAPQRESSERGQADTTLADVLQAPIKILDLCAGSGCIGVAVAKAIPEARVDFADIDKTHISAIQKNLAQNLSDYSPQLDRYNIIESDLFSNVTQTYDYILSNPPYIDPTLDRVEPSVKHHEPELALYGGRRGLELIKKIIAAAPAHLNPHGQLWLEHEPEQAVTIAELGKQAGFSITTACDQFGLLRYSQLVLQ